MSKIQPKNCTVVFPEKEKAFVISADKNAPFKTAIIGITYPDPNYHIEREPIDDLTVFEYVSEGEGQILIDGAWKKVCAGDTYVLTPGKSHHYRSSSLNPLKKIWINYISDYMKAYLQAYGIKMGIYRISSLPNFEKIEQISQKKSLTADDVYLISENIHIIISKMANESTDEDTADKIKSRLTSAIYGKLSLDSIADEFHISKSGVIRIFKKKYGVAPYEFLLNMKIEVAKSLLQTTSLSIGQIADKLCVIDEHYFSTLFHKRTGLRPLEYRHSSEAQNALSR